MIYSPGRASKRIPPITKKDIMSKGSSPRPYSVSQEEFANSFDKIFRKPSRKDIEDDQNEQEAFDYITKTLYNTEQGDKECK